MTNSPQPAIIEAVTDPLAPFDTLREHTSFSQIDTYIRCSLKYKFRYVDGLKGLGNLAMSNGTAGHAALELNDKHKIQTSQDLRLEQILDTFSDKLDSELESKEQEPLKPEQDPGKTKDGTIQALTIWRARFAPIITPIGAEVEVVMPIPPSDVLPDPVKPIVAKIDVIRRMDRVVVQNGRPTARTILADRKFPGRLPSSLQDTADMSTQLSVYDMILDQAGTPTQDLGLEHLIPPTKTIAARIIHTYRSLERMTKARRAAAHERALHTIRTVSRAVKHGIFMPTDDPRVCGSCEFRLQCQSSLVKSDYDQIALQAVLGETT